MKKKIEILGFKRECKPISCMSFFRNYFSLHPLSAKIMIDKISDREELTLIIEEKDEQEFKGKLLEFGVIF
jgi:hypothetical protein